MLIEHSTRSNNTQEPSNEGWDVFIAQDFLGHTFIGCMIQHMILLCALTMYESEDL